MQCDTTDFIYPLLVDVYYPIVAQGAYGNVSKKWVIDKVIACHLESVGQKNKQDMLAEINLVEEVLLVGRSRSDIRFPSIENGQSMSNVILTNVRDSLGNEIYIETSGPRKGKSTIFEIATNEPFVGPFGTVEHWKLVLRRSENQGVDL